MSAVTADQLVEGISNALAAGDLKAVDVMLRHLAVVDIERAEEVLTVMKAGLILGRENGQIRRGDVND